MEEAVEKKPGLLSRKFSFYEISENRNEIYGFSIFWIMLFHSYLVGANFEFASFKIIDRGNIGCELFLFLSAICMYFSYAKEKRLDVYLKRRLTRVMIPVAIICYPYWFVNYLDKECTFKTFISKALTWDFWLKGEQQIWFISFLILCYMLYPYFHGLIFGDGNKKWYKELITTVILVGLFELFLFIFEFRAPDLYKMWEIGLNRFPVFIIGVYVGKLVFEKKEISAWWLILLVGLVVLYFYGMENFGLMARVKRQWYLVGGIPLVFIFARIFHLLRKCFVNKIFIFLGNMSLEIYLFHIMLLKAYQKNKLPFSYNYGSNRNYLLILLMTVVLSYIVMVIGKYITKGIKKLLNI